MVTNYFDAPHVLKRLRSGLLGAYTDGLAQELEKRGYARCTVRDYLRAAAHFGHWAKGRSISTPELDETVVDTFGRHLRTCRCLRRDHGKRDRIAVRVRFLLSYLRQVGAVAARSVERDEGAQAPLLVAFDRWMLQHRGVAQSTLSLYRPIIAAVLATLGDDPAHFEARGLRAFLLKRAERCSRSCAKNIATALRMFLRYLIAEGKCAVGLDAAIPTVAEWRLSALPRYLPAADVERIVDACDPSTPSGSRDRAIVLLLARLGLRAGDVAALRLADIDWQGASLRVSGKGRREVRLPLTQEVGDAILAYLERGRPRVDAEHLFLRAAAPASPLCRSQAVSQIVTRAIRRAGVTTRFGGAHLLRHSAATEMLRQGLSLSDIGAVLRHRSIQTTVHYAKVDVALLRQVAQPWPEVPSC